MAKVLRLHNGAADTIGNWDTSVKIGTKAIDSIADPIGANDKHEITSIPSPFARMDLVKRAFKIVAEGSLEGKTAYHKLVSDCLDVGQIFFNIEKYRDKIEIIVWDKKNCLAELSDSDYEEHTRLGKTYKTYLEQDCDEYNFDQMDCIYLLNYIDPSAPGVMNIIGATSPATIFFTSANDLQYVGKKIKFGNDCPFDTEYKPLYKRDFEYIKYWWGLKKSRKDFARVFPEVDLYLEKCFRMLTDEQRNELRQNIVDETYYRGNYDDIPVVPTAQQYVMVLDEKLRRKRTVTNISSGFEMKVSDSLRNGNVPLALPVEMYTEPTHYVVAKWDKNTYVPYYDARPIDDRTLPDDGSKYPYVTVGDFLEDTIVKVPYKFNSEAFFNEKSLSLPYNVLHTDLKWSTNTEDKKRASKYIESILLMLRTKVLLNNGDLSKTEIVWFYPASMTQNRFNKFKAEWENTFATLFGAPISNIIAASESVAPYYYHKAKKGATSTVVSVDIGGGTTDVLIVDKGEPKYLTSFRFAANTIFGDGYSYDSDSNGFVNKYKDIITNQLETNNLRGLKAVLKSVLDKRVSTDVIAFLFSLASNKEIKKEKVEINFAKMLADDNRGKYVVILFYVAIVYHIAKLMKAKGFDMPRHMTFSGNGSKVLNILSTNDATLVRLTKIIFEEIYAQSYSIDGLDIIRPANSKESTCKGGIILTPFQSQDYGEIKDMKTILIGTDNEKFADVHMTYNDVTEADLDSVVDVIKEYIEFTFKLDKKFSFYDNFDVDRSIMNKVKDLCYRDIRTYLENGLAIKKSEIAQDGADDNLEETLFFYPLVGIINAVVRNIYQM